MRKGYVISVLLIAISLAVISFNTRSGRGYSDDYNSKLKAFTVSQLELLEEARHADLNNEKDIAAVRNKISEARLAMKAADFWMRYLEPLAYKKINGPLPVEWETEVFEKFEKPYRREGAGLTLAALYLEEENRTNDSLASLIRLSLNATSTYGTDSITSELNTHHHFFLCNRLFLLNLAAIYTTGFECPDKEKVIPELAAMLTVVGSIYRAYDERFPSYVLSPAYLELYNELVAFVNKQPRDIAQFDHYQFLRAYVNPLFALNQKMILQYHVVSHSLIDYTLNKKAASIFDKQLYNGQNTKGIFIRVNDSNALAEIEHVGKLLFYDPMLSGNNMRSCASCHKSEHYFTDTLQRAPQRYDKTGLLARNAPSLINCVYNHLVMLDGKHISLQDQTKAVIGNASEMNCSEADVMKKVLSCREYKRTFSRLLAYTPQEKEISYSHIISAITLYYGKFSNASSPFDDAMNKQRELDATAVAGFNLFMGKAQCATCHFVPQFNGVKPPYVGSEFEVLGVPADTAYSRLSPDEGRHGVNAAKETRNAFRTGSLRNAMHTAPYMHNGVFRTINEVIEFYNTGGGAGHGLLVPNQTLASDSLHLTTTEKSELVAFIRSLDEHIVFEPAPEKLPRSGIKALNKRKPGGEY
ncbi:MAG: cytochrome c peroxidase [Bacteroidota bacterium]